MRRVLLLVLCLIGAASPVRAADPGGATSAPTADNTPLRPAPATEAARQQKAALEAANCPVRPPLAEGAPSAIVVELDPDTLWRPRGAEVRFTIRNAGGTVAVTKVRVCFGWSSPDGIFRDSQGLIGSPQVRSVTNTTGAVEYGAILANLPPVPNRDWWPRRVFATTPYMFTGAFTVPVTDMVVEVTTGSGPTVVTATQVGVTDAVVAWGVVLVIILLLYLMMDGIARYRGVRGRNLALRVISTRDGYASLSQAQIVLWTLVVGLSAIYVMTLSGNLISISDGTLVLLGIASASALAARIPVAGQTVPPPAPPPDAEPITPEWSDLIIPDRASQEIDVTRLQMLAFTLITAAFVMIKVVVDYEIPTIPANFLVLMGISNGVYVGGRRLPSQPKWRRRATGLADSPERTGRAANGPEQPGSRRGVCRTIPPAWQRSRASPRGPRRLMGRNWRGAARSGITAPATDRGGHPSRSGGAENRSCLASDLGAKSAAFSKPLSVFPGSLS